MSLLINSYRFAAGEAPPVWSDDLNLSYSGTDNSWSNFTGRSALNRLLLRPSLNKFRFTIQAPADDAISVTEAFVGRSIGCRFTSTPVRATFGGANGFTLVAGGTIVSDPVNLAFSGDTDLAFSYYHNTLVGYNARVKRFDESNQYKYRGSYQGNNLVAEVGGAWNGFQFGVYSLTRVESSPAPSGWQIIWNPGLAFRNDGWNGYTGRNRYPANYFAPTKPKLRLQLLGSFTDVFIGNTTAGSFTFTSTPIRLTFGGANATPGNDLFVSTTDEFLASLVDFTLPVLLSVHSNASSLGAGPIDPSVGCGYNRGNSAASLAPPSTPTSVSGSVALLRVDQND